MYGNWHALKVIPGVDFILFIFFFFLPDIKHNNSTDLDGTMPLQELYLSHMFILW